MNLSTVGEKVKEFKDQRIFRDKIFIWYLVAAAVLTILTILVLLVRLRPQDFVVPLEYSSIQGFTVLGEWYQLIGLGVFSLLAVIGNTILAAHTFSKSRIASFFLVVGTVIVNLFVLVIAVVATSQLGG